MLTLRVTLILLLAAAPTLLHADAPTPEPADASDSRLASGQVTLGPRYLDSTSGYSMCFPEGWGYKTIVDGKPWILDATDRKTGMISVAFVPFPATTTADQVRPEVIAKHQAAAQPTAVIHATGRGELADHPAIWLKYTADIPMTNGKIRMTAVHYVVPLGDGRALELRVAALPDKFDDLAKAMKESVKTFRLEERSKPESEPR